MLKKMIFAGFGGQGVMTIGQLVGYAACDSGLNISYYPSYGSEQRGGTANCTVILSDEEIGSPVSLTFNAAILLNAPAYRQFIDAIAPGGVAVVNTDLVAKEELRRTDIDIVAIPVTTMAREIGTERCANLVALGALNEKVSLLTWDDLHAMMKKKLGKKPEFAVMNEQAVSAGRTAAQG